MSTDREAEHAEQAATGAAAEDEAAARPAAGDDAAHPAAEDAGAAEAAGEDAVAAEPAGEGAVAEPAAEEETAARVAALEAELASVRAQLAEAEERVKRAQADFANYRRRMLAEQARWEDRGVARLAADLLPVADNLERALAAFEQARGGDPEAFRQGIELTLRQLLDALARYEIRPIEAVGQPFDPRFHEAIGQVETDAVPEDHVAAQVQRGYVFKSEVLRPALVQVARRPARQDSHEPVTGEEGDHDGEGRGH